MSARIELEAVIRNKNLQEGGGCSIYCKCLNISMKAEKSFQSHCYVTTFQTRYFCLIYLICVTRVSNKPSNKSFKTRRKFVLIPANLLLQALSENSRNKSEFSDSQYSVPVSPWLLVSAQSQSLDSYFLQRAAIRLVGSGPGERLQKYCISRFP